MTDPMYLIDPSNAFLDRYEVGKCLKCRESKIRAMESDPKLNFPKPLRIGGNSTVVWLFADIIRWAADHRGTEV